MRDRPEAVPDAVEELLRYLSVVQNGQTRTAVTEITIGRTTIAPGDLVFCSLPSANRAVDLLDDGAELDLARGQVAHLAFGHGIHHRLGAPLARMELRIALPALLRRFPGLRLAVPAEDVSFRTMSQVYGVHTLPVAW